MKKAKIVKIDGSINLQIISQGNTAEIYRYDRTKIIKLFRESFPYRMIANEYSLTEKTSEVLSCVPKTFNMAEYKNRYGIILKKVDGKNMISKMAINPLKLKSYAKQLARIHTQLLSCEVGLNVNIKDNIARNIARSKDLSKNEKEKLLNYLQTLPDGNSLCHMDFHPGNVMVKNKNFFVIDWMTACNGDKDADAARTFLLMSYGEPTHANKLVKFFAGIFERRIGKIYLREYKNITGSTDEDIEKWLLPLAAARLVEWITDNEKEELLKFIRKKLSEPDSLLSQKA